MLITHNNKSFLSAQEVQMVVEARVEAITEGLTFSEFCIKGYNYFLTKLN